MPAFKSWFGQLSLKTRSSSSTLPDSKELPAKMVHAVHERDWGALKREGKFNVQPDANMEKQILLLVMGAPGVGKKSLVKSLLYGDMLGGAALEYSLLMMEDEVPRYYCDGYIYCLKVVIATDPQASLAGIYPRYDYFELILAYDISSPASLDFLAQLREDIVHESEPSLNMVPTAIFGLKSDLLHENGNGVHASLEEGQALAAEIGCQFDQCSAKTGQGVYEAFGHFVERARNHEVGASATTASVGHQVPVSGIEQAFTRLLGVGLSDKRG